MTSIHVRDTLALVLAGGPGTRLDVLTDRRVKPAMPYAGVFRLIDIPLSNLHHSGLPDVWVIEQYRPHSLNEQLANGRPWDLDRTHGGLRVLPPYQDGDSDKEGFAEGNADAIYQHVDFLREMAPDRFLVLSSDHVYMLDYSEVIAWHREKEADLTMVTTEVPLESAGRFGVVEVDSEGRVTQFDYKPDDPQSTTVTAEVFVYEADVLLDTLNQLVDEEGREGLEDYGDNLLPRLVENRRVFGYPLDGYWRDAGTVQSYWEGHMDLLRSEAGPHLDDPDWPLLTLDPKHLPARLYKSAVVDDSLISPGCTVRGEVHRSVLSPGTVVEEGAVVRNAVLLHDVHVQRGARVDCSVLDENVTVGEEARVGAPLTPDGPPQITLVGMGVEVSGSEQVRGGRKLAPASKS